MTAAGRAAAGAALATGLALAATAALVPRTSDGIVPTIDVAAIAQLIDQVSTLARQVQHLSGIELSMEDIVDTLGETAEVSAHRSQLDGTIDSVRRDAYADVDPANRPDHNDPESMNAAVPGIPEFASHADAREWAVERYFVALDPSASTEFQGMGWARARLGNVYETVPAQMRILLGDAAALGEGAEAGAIGNASDRAQLSAAAQNDGGER